MVKSRSARAAQRSLCPREQYYDSVVERCSDCVDVCSLPADLRFCSINCPAYYRKHYTVSVDVQRTASSVAFTTSTSAAAGSDSVNPLLQHPLFWTFIASTTVATLTFIAIVVLCIIRCRQAAQRQRVRTCWAFLRPVHLTEKRSDVEKNSKHSGGGFQKVHADTFKNSTSNSKLYHGSQEQQSHHHRHQQQQQQQLVICRQESSSPPQLMFDKSGTGWNGDHDDDRNRQSINLHSNVTQTASVSSGTRHLVDHEQGGEGQINLVPSLHRGEPLCASSKSQTSVSFVPPNTGSCTIVNLPANDNELQRKPMLSDQNDITDYDTDSIDNAKRILSSSRQLFRESRQVDDYVQVSDGNCDITAVKLISDDDDISDVSNSNFTDPCLHRMTSSPQPSRLLVSGASFNESMKHNRVVYVVHQPSISDAGYVT